MPVYQTLPATNPNLPPSQNQFVPATSQFRAYQQNVAEYNRVSPQQIQIINQEIAERQAEINTWQSYMVKYKGQQSMHQFIAKISKLQGEIDYLNQSKTNIEQGSLANLENLDEQSRSYAIRTQAYQEARRQLSEEKANAPARRAALKESNWSGTVEEFDNGLKTAEKTFVKGQQTSETTYTYERTSNLPGETLPSVSGNQLEETRTLQQVQVGTFNGVPSYRVMSVGDVTGSSREANKEEYAYFEEQVGKGLTETVGVPRSFKSPFKEFTGGLTKPGGMTYLNTKAEFISPKVRTAIENAIKMEGSYSSQFSPFGKLNQPGTDLVAGFVGGMIPVTKGEALVSLASLGAGIGFGAAVRGITYGAEAISGTSVSIKAVGGLVSTEFSLAGLPTALKVAELGTGLAFLGVAAAQKGYEIYKTPGTVEKGELAGAFTRDLFLFGKGYQYARGSQVLSTVKEVLRVPEGQKLIAKDIPIIGMTKDNIYKPELTVISEGALGEGGVIGGTKYLKIKPYVKGENLITKDFISVGDIIEAGKPVGKFTQLPGGASEVKIIRDVGGKDYLLQLIKEKPTGETQLKIIDLLSDKEIFKKVLPSEQSPYSFLESTQAKPIKNFEQVITPEYSLRRDVTIDKASSEAVQLGDILPGELKLSQGKFVQKTFLSEETLVTPWEENILRGLFGKETKKIPTEIIREDLQIQPNLRKITGLETIKDISTGKIKESGLVGVESISPRVVNLAKAVSTGRWEIDLIREPTFKEKFGSKVGDILTMKNLVGKRVGFGRTQIVGKAGFGEPAFPWASENKLGDIGKLDLLLSKMKSAKGIKAGKESSFRMKIDTLISKLIPQGKSGKAELFPLSSTTERLITEVKPQVPEVEITTTKKLSISEPALKSYESPIRELNIPTTRGLTWLDTSRLITSALPTQRQQPVIMQQVKYIQDLKTDQEIKQELNQELDIKQELQQRQQQRQQQQPVQQQQQQQQQIVELAFAGVPRSPTLPRVPTIPTTKMPKIDLDERKRAIRRKLALQRLYSLQLKKRGKFKQVATGLTKGEAIIRGSDLTLKDIARTFKITPTGRTREMFQEEITMPDLGKFRSYAIRKGKPIQLKDTFIQRTSANLQSKQEKYSLAEARRLKKLIGF